jgi:hypothetical protein
VPGAGEVQGSANEVEWRLLVLPQAVAGAPVLVVGVLRKRALRHCSPVARTGPQCARPGGTCCVMTGCSPGGNLGALLDRSVGDLDLRR